MKNVRKSYLIAFIVLQLFFSGHAWAVDNLPVSYLGIERGLSNNSVRCIYRDHLGFMWFGTYDGLNRYDGYEFKVFRNKLYDSTSLPHNYIYTISEDLQHNLWIGTEGGGVNILTPFTGSVDYLLPGEGKNHLTSESVFAIYVDKESRKWLGTIKGGINIIDPRKRRFQTLSHDPLDRNSLIYNFVSSFYEDSDRNLWIGTDGGGMSIWNRKTNDFTNFRHEAGNSASLSHNSVSSIAKDYLNNIWIATFGGGINKFNKASGSFERYNCINDRTGELNKNVWLLLEDRDKNLWASTFGGGKFYRFNRTANKFEMFDSDLYDLIALAEDRNGTLWAGNSHQLIKIDKQNKKHVFIEIGKPIRALFEDNKGNFWIGAEGGGLILFNRQQGKIALRYSDADGLCNNAVLNILEDNKGHLWLSTFNGLSEFDPVKKTFKNYYQDDGLQGNQFLYNAALRLHSGELAFGGIKGFNIFYPDSINIRNYTPPVILTTLRINNTPVTLDSRYVTKTKEDRISTLTIPYNDAVLSFEFAALEYSAPRKISYAYYLEGWDKSWNYTGNLRTANYTHLNEGNYTLQIKSTNAEGVWNPQEVSIKVVVLPPWYRSWWAYTLYIIVIGGAIILYQRFRIRQARLEYAVALAKVNAEKERAKLERERIEKEKAQAEYEAIALRHACHTIKLTTWLFCTSSPNITAAYIRTLFINYLLSPDQNYA